MLESCNCCDEEGSLTAIEAHMTPDCHLSLEFRNGASNSQFGCRYLDKYPNQTTNIVFMCDPSAGARGYLEPTYFNDDRDYCSISFVWKTSVVCGVKSACIPHTPFSVIITFSIGSVLTMTLALVLVACHKRHQSLGYVPAREFE